MFRLSIAPNHKFKDLLNCIAFEQAQLLSEESLDPTPFTENNSETFEFNKVLATHCVLKKNIKPIFSILLLTTNENFTKIAVFQYVIKPIPSKQQFDVHSLVPFYEVKKIWEIGSLFKANQNIDMFETLYNSKSPRLIESSPLEIFLNSVSSRTIDCQNKDCRSLSKSAMIFNNKVESISLSPNDVFIESNIKPTQTIPQSNIFSTARFEQILRNIERKSAPSFNVTDKNITFVLNESETRISFDIEYIKKNPNNIFNEMLYLSIDPYIILDCLKSIGIRFPRLTYAEAKKLAQNLSTCDLLHLKGLESHFDLVVLELYKRKIIS
jgi:hypothetical protein